MEKRYVVISEQCDEMDECRFGYPQIWHRYPVAICETQEHAERIIEDFLQEEADRFMDWLDVCKDYIALKMTDLDGYYDPDRADLYSIAEVPYYQ